MESRTTAGIDLANGPDRTEIVVIGHKLNPILQGDPADVLARIYQQTGIRADSFRHVADSSDGVVVSLSREEARSCGTIPCEVMDAMAPFAAPPENTPERAKFFGQFYREGGPRGKTQSDINAFNNRVAKRRAKRKKK